MTPLLPYIAGIAGQIQPASKYRMVTDAKSDEVGSVDLQHISTSRSTKIVFKPPSAVDARFGASPISYDDFMAHWKAGPVADLLYHVSPVFSKINCQLYCSSLAPRQLTVHSSQ